MRLLIVGSLTSELGRAASMAADRGAEIASAASADAALVLLRREATIGLVFCEVQHRPADLVATLARERINVSVVACGLETDADAAVDAIRGGAIEFLPLPPDPELIAAILEATASERHALIARDPAMLAVIRKAELVAGSDASIMIGGESGTGKEVLARFIHRKSRRAGRPFVALNCAAIPEDLLESELFGHEKGAFSGAVARRLGKFEAASGGTLLLDEVSEMDARLQAKLLRALQEREVDRVGGSSPVKIDVRVLATSNRDLQAEIRSGRFRADLFFRLNVVGVVLPPLRNRRADIAALARHYAQHYAALNDVAHRPLSAAALSALEDYAWPGNVRELENTMHRSVLLARGGEIGIGAIELDGAPSPTSDAPAVATRSSGATISSVSGLVGRSVDDVERALIIETLGHTSGNRTHAATILGISIRALRNKLKLYAQEGLLVPPPMTGEAA